MSRTFVTPRTLAGLLIAVFAAAVPSLAVTPDEPSTEAVRGAVGRALPLLQKGAEGHTRHVRCFSCHNQTLPVLALSIARERGFSVEEKAIEEQARFTEADLRGARESYRQGRGQGGQATRAGYALWTLEMGGWKPDETTAAVTEFLLGWNGNMDHWRTSASRPPSEVSSFTSTAVSLRALQVYGTTEQKERIAARVARAREWLLKTPANNTEDRVFRLWGLKYAAADEGAVRDAAKQLLETQREDGGWSQLPDLASDAYATGSALVALHQVGRLPVDDPAYRRGLRFLLKNQREDGSWYVKSRSKPFQPYFETGFPHEKDQFISSAASGWAAAALALSLPVKR